MCYSSEGHYFSRLLFSLNDVLTYTYLLQQTEEGSRDYFHALSTNENSRVLQSRYTQLKTWLAAAEGRSLIASGTQENDGELRRLIAAVENEETVSHMNIFPYKALSSSSDQFLGIYLAYW